MCLIKFSQNGMTSFKGMDELFWGKDMEDVFDWIKRMWMATKVWELDEEKLFKIVKLNLKGKAWYWYRWLDLAPHDYATL